MLSFKPTFSLSSFIFIKRLFSSYSLSAIRMVSSEYLRLLIFLPAILIPACASSSLAYPGPEVRGGSREELPGARGQGRWPRGATRHPRSGAEAERSYPMSEVRSRGCALLEQ